MNSLSQNESFLLFEKTLNEISDTYKIVVYQPNFDSFNNELGKINFLNSQHLNYYGSKIFTEQFCAFFNSDFKNIK
jgi:hypothetical protein